MTSCILKKCLCHSVTCSYVDLTVDYTDNLGLCSFLLIAPSNIPKVCKSPKGPKAVDGNAAHCKIHKFSYYCVLK